MSKSVRAAMEEHVERDDTAGVAWLVAVGDDVQVGTAGVLTRGEDRPVQRDSIFRIASMTKPIAAVATLLLIEDGTLRLQDPVDELLPELAGRRVLVDGEGPLDGETVPAIRPITLYDVLTFTLGYGMDFSAPFPQPLMNAMAELNLGAGPPDPSVAPPEEWIKGLGTLPLLYQPGERWLYNTGSDVLGILLSRAAGQPLEDLLRERIFEPLGMSDTGFHTTATDRLGTCYAGGPGVVYDGPDGGWSKAPSFASGGGGLVSTVDDYFAFARVLLNGGAPLLSRASVDTMTTVHVAEGPSPDGSLGWGFGVGVTQRRTGIARSVGSYGWDGGLGSSWANDPTESLIGIILTTDAFTSAFPPPAIMQDFWTLAYASLG